MRTWLGRRGAAILATVVAVGAPPAAHAQGGGTATPLVLQLRPRAGDTLRLRVDQTIEMGGETRASASDSLDSQVTTLALLARLAIESTDGEGATVVAMTDSVRVESSDAYQSPVLRAARQMQGQRVRFRVAPDGATSLGAGDAWTGAAMGSLLSQLPATLPREPLMPGGTWTRSLDIPLAATAVGRGNATLTATFRFDSLSRSGEYAYLTLRGRLLRAGPMAPREGSGRKGDGGFAQTSGTVSGSILLDRRRGWIADARTVISLKSLVTPKTGDGAPMRVRMRITQWMRVL